MDENRIDVSVSCVTYNHAPYLRQCLDGFIMQKDVSFEVLIHDDASTDNTQEIIREYAEKYPDIIKPIYQNENQYSKGVDIWNEYQFPRAKGKYIALCEGDDYWTDPYKLKKQVDALENNKDCYMCVHRVQRVFVDGSKTQSTIPNNALPSGKIEADRFIRMFNENYVFQTSSYFFSTQKILDFVKNLPDFAKGIQTRDVVWMLYFASVGNYYYIDNIMSSYRINVPNSWSKTIPLNKKLFLEHINTYYETVELYEKYTYYRFDLSLTKKKILFRNMLMCRKFHKAFKYAKENNIMALSVKSKVKIMVEELFPKVFRIFQKHKYKKKG